MKAGKKIKTFLDNKNTTFILIGIFSLIIVLSIFVTTVNVMDTNTTENFTTYDFEYAYKDGRFSEALKERKQNGMNNYIESTDSMKEYYVIADYYEAALNYKIAISNNKNANKYKEIMDEKRKEIIMYEYYLDEVHDILDID